MHIIRLKLHSDSRVKGIGIVLLHTLELSALLSSFGNATIIHLTARFMLFEFGMTFGVWNPEHLFIKDEQ